MHGSAAQTAAKEDAPRLTASPNAGARPSPLSPPPAAGGKRSAARPAAFLDRDGTIITERYYLADPDRVELIHGAAAAMRRFAAAGRALVVVTNQSGIARGLYTLHEFDAVQRRLMELLAAEGVALDGVYLCLHHPDFTGPCACRKPGVALYDQAAQDLNLDIARSVFIGDRLKDVLPAETLGGRGILVRTGYGTDQEHEAPANIDVVEDLTAAASLVLDDRAAWGARSTRH